MHSYVLLRTKMWDFIQIRPSLNPAIPPKKLSPKKGTYIYICRFWYKNKKLPYSEIPTVVKLGDVNENTTIVEFGILQITIEVNLKEPKVTQPNPD